MIDREKCTGCTACYAICSKSAIKMEQDTEGFLYPSIQKEKCISCGLCDKVCPVGKEGTAQTEKVFACRANNSEIVERSSSGGIFSLLAEEILARNGIVIGCALVERVYAKHIVIESLKDLEKLRRSKYVQSDKQDVFKIAKEKLDSGKIVMFVGTPCETAGLQSYLRKKYDNLLLVDFICHGTPSPLVWSRYIEYMNKKQQSEVVDANFRNKKCGWRKFSMELSFADKSKTLTVLTEDDYLRGFLSDLYLRKSCYTCSFKGENYCSDITIGDFFAVNRAMPEIDHDEGTSLVITHTSQGINFLESVKPVMQCWDLDESFLKYNGAYFSSPHKNYWRKKAIREITREDFHTVIERYCGLGIKSKIRRKISRILAK